MRPSHMLRSTSRATVEEALEHMTTIRGWVKLSLRSFEGVDLHHLSRVSLFLRLQRSACVTISTLGRWIDYKGIVFYPGDSLGFTTC